MPGPAATRRLVLALAAGLALSACGGREEAPLTSPPGTQFPPLAYDYLMPLRLNVGSVAIEQSFVPQSGDLGGIAPVPPVSALRQMGQDRLGAFGADGRAVFTVRDATLRRESDEYVGVFAVTLALFNGDTRVGFAEAQVNRRRTISAIMPRDAALYALTKDLMDQMNVEFEYQVRQTLRDFLVAAPSAAPAVEQQPLTAPAAAAAPPPASSLVPAASAPSPLPAPVPLVPAAPSAPGALPPGVRSLGTMPAI